ncbi:methionyl-tRNA formyltransferase [Neobacillus piezotolerans]|uniref:Methionyl-tRNA formyltransferase n=1 Tax=Neobacillus piezotolerans TaxID=2259171 RepID=A0A3D8GVM1_9BACI|nr:methionyl-tRNA formyltransferase [Neobacillus piezotolerans]RDU38523.1 methionyl-tRNA formyltransferase [Neobacillus piezotolerans]
MTRIVFMGTPDFSVPVLRRLIEDGYEVAAVVTQPDRPVGRKRVLTPPPVKVEAERHGIPVLQPEKIRLKEEVGKVLAFAPDIIVTAAFGQILPKELLESPPHGCINVHASLLPELRGGAPIHYSIIQGKEKTGITIMYMEEKLDAGDILTQAEVPITETDTVGTLHDKLSAAGAELLSETMPKLLKGELSPVKQNEDEATFAFNIKREEERVDWNKTGEEIYNQIRGMNPWPVAYTTLSGTVVKLWAAEKVQLKGIGQPGQIVSLDELGITVGTGNETGVKITELQPSGKKPMDAGQFLRGAGSKLQAGHKFGD